MSKTKTEWIEDSAVTTIKINDTAVTNAKLNSDVAGTGLSGGAGSALSVDYGTSAGTACQGNDSRLPSGLTDNRLLKADGTTGIQSTGITIDDSNNMQEVNIITGDAIWGIGSSGTSFDWDLINGQHQTVTLSANCTCTVDATGITGPGVFTLNVKQNGTGGYSITSYSISGGTVYYTGTTRPTYPSSPDDECEVVLKFNGTNCIYQVTGVLTSDT